MNNYELPIGCFGLSPKLVRGPCAFGCDIRPGSWDLVVGDVHRNEAGVWVTRPVFIGKVRDEVDVLFVAKQYHARVGVCDTRPETTLAKRLQIAGRDCGIEVWRAEYNTAPSSIPAVANHNEGVLKLDRTMALDDVHYAFHTGIGIIIPQNYREITGGDFERELISSTRVPTRWMGKDCYSWEHSGPDHSFHMLGYLLAAIKVGNLIAYGGIETMGATLGAIHGRANEVAAARKRREEMTPQEIEALSAEFYRADMEEAEGLFLEV
jgi:hypothetical protein